MNPGPPEKITEAWLMDLVSRSVGHLNRGEFEKADKLLTDAFAAVPDSPEVLTLMGVTRLAQARYAESETLLSRALAVNPRQPMILFNLGEAKRGLGLPEPAAALYRSALKERADFPDAEIALAATLRKLDQLPEAEALYRGLLRRDARYAPALAGLGAVLNDLGQYGEAERLLMPAVTLPAEKLIAAEIEEALGTAKWKQGRPFEALPHFERATALWPPLRSAEKSRAAVLEALDQWERARFIYLRLLAREPLDLEVHRLLDELLGRMGRQDERLRSYDDAILSRPTSPLPLTVKADRLMQLGRTAEAASHYRRALTIAPDNQDAHRGLDSIPNQ